MQSEHQPIFPAMAEQIVAGCMIYFMRTYWRTDQTKLNNKDFIKFLYASSNEDLKVVFELDYMKDYRNCVNYISGKSNQTQGVNSHIGSALRELFIGPFAQHDFGRSQGVKILCGLQNVSGLADEYGETGEKRILASFQNIVAFRNSDYDTRQFLMERMGSNYRNTSFSPQQHNINIQWEGHTVEDWNILTLKLGEAIVSLKDESPFLFTMPKYR